MYLVMYSFKVLTWIEVECAYFQHKLKTSYNFEMFDATDSSPVNPAMKGPIQLTLSGISAGLSIIFRWEINRLTHFVALGNNWQPWRYLLHLFRSSFAFLSTPPLKLAGCWVVPLHSSFVHNRRWLLAKFARFYFVTVLALAVCKASYHG